MRAVVTGASGFIGRALTKQLLAEGWQVHAVVRSPETVADLSGEGLTVVQAELGEYDRLGERIGERGFDAFFHLAWDGTFGDSFRDYHRQMKNAACAGDALMAAVGLEVKRFILAETIVELEAKHYMLRDGGQPRVSCIYGTAKAAADMVCRTLACQNGMAFNGAVLASVYGEGDRSRMIQNVLIRALRRGESPRLVSGENLYDWIYVDDVARALITIADKGKPDKTYYVGHRELQTFAYLVSRTRDIVAPEVPLTFGTLEDKTIMDYSLIDREALYNDTGYECQADFEESIRKTAQWLKRTDREPVIVVGAGFSGSVMARKVAEELDRRVIVLEKRPHIAGNMYDEVDEHGILVQKYGPHFIFTAHHEVVKYLLQYAELFPFAAKLVSFVDGRYVRLPFNFETVQQLAGLEKSAVLLEKLRKAFCGRDRVVILELVDHPDPDISAYGTMLFEKFYRPYTSKMWGMQPEQIDKSVLERVPMAMNYDERYQKADYQYLPKEGFTKLFENILNHPNIEVRLGMDALEHISLEDGKVFFDGRPAECVVYTGPVDELFHGEYGALPYRSLDIRYEYSAADSVLPGAIVSYPQAPGCTRSTEYRKIMYDDSAVRGSVVATEYPLAYDPAAKTGNTPYYPVLTDASKAMYERYREKAAGYKGLFLCGRLAEFRYYNMDMCILHALAYFENVREYLTRDKKETL